METEQAKYQGVQDRVQELKEFYSNVRKLLFFIILLGAVNYAVNGLENPWFLWIIGLMSIGLAIDAIRTFVRPLIFKNWEKRKIEALMEKNNF